MDRDNLSRAEVVVLGVFSVSFGFILANLPFVSMVLCSHVDLDECDLGIGRCRRNQECLNTVGSYQCVVKCSSGFRRADNGQSCEGRS